MLILSRSFNKHGHHRPDWSISKKSSPLKPLGQMNQNLKKKILKKIGQSETRIACGGHVC
jgi:hypothetical protein